MESHLGSLGSHGSPSTCLNKAEFFAVCLSDFHPQLAVGATDGTCSTTITYFTVKFRNLHCDIASKKAICGIQNLSNGL